MPAWKTESLTPVSGRPAQSREGSSSAAFRAELAEVLSGLRADQKRLPCRYLYDARGSRLFEQICALPEYYLTRSETAILRRSGREMADLLGPSCLLIEPGSGAGGKVRLLLDQLSAPAGYVPIEIAREPLMRASEKLREDYPTLKIIPICGDFTRLHFFTVAALSSVPARRRVVFFPGSTIGNFGPAEAESFLGRMADLCGPGGGLLVGVDLKKDQATLERAYNDAQGITAAFNLNLLLHVNRVLGADFDPEKFRHAAPYNGSASRIEMHLVSLEDQTVSVAGVPFMLRRGETICTEHSYKYSLDEFEALARRSGFRRVRVWLDEQRCFSVQYFSVPPRTLRGHSPAEAPRSRRRRPDRRRRSPRRAPSNQASRSERHAGGKGRSELDFNDR